MAIWLLNSWGELTILIPLFMIGWPMDLQKVSSMTMPRRQIDICLLVDLNEIEELRSHLVQNVKLESITNRSDVPFGILEEDWRRLYLLERRLPDTCVLKPRLVKAFRVLITALYQAHADILWNVNEGQVSQGVLQEDKNTKNIIVSTSRDALTTQAKPIDNNVNNKEDRLNNKEGADTVAGGDNEPAESNQLETSVPLRTLPSSVGLLPSTTVWKILPHRSRFGNNTTFSYITNEVRNHSQYPDTTLSFTTAFEGETESSTNNRPVNGKKEEKTPLILQIEGKKGEDSNGVGSFNQTYSRISTTSSESEKEIESYVFTDSTVTYPKATSPATILDSSTGSEYVRSFDVTHSTTSETSFMIEEEKDDSVFIDSIIMPGQNKAKSSTVRDKLTESMESEQFNVTHPQNHQTSTLSGEERDNTFHDSGVTVSQNEETATSNIHDVSMKHDTTQFITATLPQDSGTTSGLEEVTGTSTLSNPIATRTQVGGTESSSVNYLSTENYLTTFVYVTHSHIPETSSGLDNATFHNSDETISHYENAATSNIYNISRTHYETQFVTTTLPENSSTPGGEEDTSTLSNPMTTESRVRETEPSTVNYLSTESDITKFINLTYSNTPETSSKPGKATFHDSDEKISQDEEAAASNIHDVLMKHDENPFISVTLPHIPETSFESEQEMHNSVVPDFSVKITDMEENQSKSNTYPSSVAEITESESQTQSQKFVTTPRSEKEVTDGINPDFSSETIEDSRVSHEDYYGTSSERPKTVESFRMFTVIVPRRTPTYRTDAVPTLQMYPPHDGSSSITTTENRCRNNKICVKARSLEYQDSRELYIPDQSTFK